MKPLRFTRHARNRMRWRQIAGDDVVDCIRDPEARQDLPSGEVNCWKTLRGEWLRVIYVEEPDAMVVVTVVYPAKRPRGERT